MTIKSKLARPFVDVDTTAPVVGHIVATIARKEVRPLYAVEGGHATFGMMIDDFIREHYSDDNGELQDIALELDEDTRAAIRERVRNGNY